jgi:hypothetical protein
MHVFQAGGSLASFRLSCLAELATIDMMVSSLHAAEASYMTYKKQLSVIRSSVNKHNRNERCKTSCCWQPAASNNNQSISPSGRRWVITNQPIIN